MIWVFHRITHNSDYQKLFSLACKKKLTVDFQQFVLDAAEASEDHLMTAASFDRFIMGIAVPEFTPSWTSSHLKHFSQHIV